MDPGANSAELPPPLAALRRFARQRDDRQRCELCSGVLADEHQHLLELPGRQLRCSCDACAILFPGHEHARFRRVPRRTVRLDNFVLDDTAWASLHLPIDLAFLYQTGSPPEVMAVYPSPAGGTHSSVDLPCWRELTKANPVLEQLEPEVETLLVNRVGPRREYYRAPIDVCYRLVGLIRLAWRGLSGGSKVWTEIDRFFAELRAQTAGRHSARGDEFPPFELPHRQAPG